MKPPGQLAYEAYKRSLNTNGLKYDDLAEEYKIAFEAAATAVLLELNRKYREKIVKTLGFTRLEDGP